MAAELSVNAVVHIRTTFERKSLVYDEFFGQLFKYFENSPRKHPYVPLTAFGSGVIISDDGYIVTNNHVVQDASKVEVTLNDKRTYTASIIGNDPSTDLALIKIEEDLLPYLLYGNSDAVQVGEWVLAVGNPFNLTSTVTAGIVSAKARDINILGSNTALETFIQTDAAVNKGNSGGALVNTNGELIGINAAIASNTGYYEGYSFAIPANIVKKVVGDFVEYGAVQRAYIGVTINELNAEFVKQNGIDEIKGVYVNSISENGGAHDAGIKPGDIIMAIENTEVNSMTELQEVIGQHRPGDHVQIILKRDGGSKTFRVELKNQQGTIELAKREVSFFHEFLGADLRELNPGEKNQLGLNDGYKIEHVELGGLLQKGGVREGFIIKSLNDYKIDSQQAIDRAIRRDKSRLKVKGIYPNGMEFVYVFQL
jgi:serine protease Do